MVFTKIACQKLPTTQFKKSSQSLQTNRLCRHRVLQRVSKLLVVRAEQRKKFNQVSSRGQGTYDKKLAENISLNKRFLKCKDAQELLQILQKQQQMMNYVNISTAAVVIARNILSDIKNCTDKNNLKNIDAVYVVLCQLMQKRIDKMDVQGVCNCLWSLGKAVDVLGAQKIQEHKFVFQILCSRAMTVSNYLKTQGASNILWAMAKFQWDDQQQIQRIVQQAVNTTKKNYLPQQICNIFWAMATLKYQNLKATQHFVNLAKKCVHEMDSQAISNLLWALQQLRFYDQELNLEVENVIINSDIKLTCQNISNLAMAFTDFGLEKNSKICKILVQQFISNKTLNEQDLANFLYALALLNCPVNITQQVVDKSIVLKDIFLDIVLNQIMMAQIFYNIKGQKLLFSPDFEEKCKKSLQAHAKIIKENSFKDAVFMVVQSHFEFSKKNVLIYDNQIQINITLQQEEKIKVAVNTWTTQSYFANCREKLLGRCQHWVFLLEQLGWQVVQVSASQWGNSLYQQQIIKEIKEKLTQ